MFNYRYFDDLIRRLIICNSRPMQMELHPGYACNVYNCRYCYGKDQELTTCRDVTIEEYYKLLDDLKGKVKFIHLSGIKSDPLNNRQIYNIIKRIKDNGLNIGISTKGFLLDQDLCYLLNAKATSGDFITLSIDASDEKIYNMIHGINKHKKLFDIVRNNLMQLYNSKKQASSSLIINVSYLLFKDNSSYEQLDRFIELFGPISDRVRFSLPQIPNKTNDKPDYFIDSLKNIRENIRKLMLEHPDLNILFLEFNDPAHHTSFRYCYAQRFNAVIDHCGYVYPCPQVATREYQKISYGNIKNRNFWELWESDCRRCILDMEIDKMECRICDRKDEMINIELSKVFNDERVS